MDTDTQDYSVHAKKMYRVILESVDPQSETADTFALKLSLRLKVPLPRIKRVVRNMPHVLKRGLDANKANTLKRILEEFGGVVRLEMYMVDPKHVREPAPEPEPDVLVPDATGDTGERVTCPSCGWDELANASFCSLCLRRFRDDRKRTKSLGSRLPGDNPLHETQFRAPNEIVDQTAPLTAKDVWERHKFLIVAGVAVIAILIALLK